ncbi:hypothetical protein QE152_g9943 [Popillia japonica]|uniref:Uncharacterized protein n=1 Tax=Popillia japonica TaxID=7064 RepID=A0AAW1LWV6_POPJA
MTALGSRALCGYDVNVSDQLTGYRKEDKSLYFSHKIGVFSTWNTCNGRTCSDSNRLEQSAQIIIVFGLQSTRAKCTNHYLEKSTNLTTGKEKRIIRRYCKYCYEKIAAISGRNEAKRKATKVSTYCKSYPDNPFLCFESVHKNK